MTEEQKAALRTASERAQQPSATDVDFIELISVMLDIPQTRASMQYYFRTFADYKRRREALLMTLPISTAVTA